MRLNKFLARTGIGSRRICDKYIKDRKIKINGKIITDFSYLVKDDDYIQFKNKTINYVEEDIYYILNKPINYISSSKDELNRRLILELLPVFIFVICLISFHCPHSFLFSFHSPQSS